VKPHKKGSMDLSRGCSVWTVICYNLFLSAILKSFGQSLGIGNMEIVLPSTQAQMKLVIVYLYFVLANLDQIMVSAKNIDSLHISLVFLSHIFYNLMMARIAMNG
jgi:hypothetical protein